MMPSRQRLREYLEAANVARQRAHSAPTVQGKQILQEIERCFRRLVEIERWAVDHEHGFNDQQVKDLQERARGLKAKRQPIEAQRHFPKAEWLQPVLLADVEYRRKTTNGLLRHPSYKGLREDLMKFRFR